MICYNKTKEIGDNMHDDLYYMNEAYKQALKAFKEDEVPDYPPYHPECVCNWHYLRETDVEDEVELIEEFEE